MNEPVWRLAGLVWAGEQAELEWLAPSGGRTSRLDLGAHLALTTGAGRRCIGVWWDGRRIPCATREEIDAVVKTGQCSSCAAMARSRSVATDTRLDDPREFAVYLAHHGPVVKVGITAVQRGAARFLEQGALSAVILSTGTLLSARRCEALLTTALGLPQHVSTVRKRAARAAPPPCERRSVDLWALADRAAGLAWPEGQRFVPTRPVDLTGIYGLASDGVHPAATLRPLETGATIAGVVACRIGRDLYIETSAGVVLVDTGLVQGWGLARAGDGAPLTADLEPVARRLPEPDALF